MDAPLPGWLAFGASVRGATHAQRDLPNQDALAWAPPDGHGPPLVLALADGHGEARSFRSHHGARLAVQAACELGTALAQVPGRLAGAAPSDLAGGADRPEVGSRGGNAPPPQAGAVSGPQPDRPGVGIVPLPSGMTSPEARSTPGQAIDLPAFAGPREVPPGEALSSTGAGFGRRLTDRWRQLVEAHRAANPAGWDEAIAALERAGDRQAPAELHGNPLLAYGSTLLFAVITAEGLLYGQLGDGDILEIGDPPAVRRPLPADPRLVGNLTTSLCQPDSWRDFRVAFRPAAAAPLAVLLATDGYGNSFRDPAGFLQVGPDLVDALRNDGLAAVRDHLPGWLEETSREGSGDDISAGLLIRPQALGVGEPGGGRGVHG